MFKAFFLNVIRINDQWRNRINQIVHGSREITSDTALLLGKFFGIEPEFWLNLQMRYNLKITKNIIGG